MVDFAPAAPFMSEGAKIGINKVIKSSFGLCL
jgi:hypothetical protein